MKILEERRQIEEKNQGEALCKLDQIGWTLKWEPRFKKCLEYLQGRKEAKILDLGSGVTSSFLRLLKGKGYKNLTGFDLTESASREAEKHGLKILVGDLEGDDFAKLFKGEKFDFIILSEVIEHLFYPDEVLRKIRKILKPKGRLILSTPNTSHWINGLLLTFFPKALDSLSTAFGSETHLHFYTFYSLKEILEKSGFKVDDFTGVRHCPRKVIKNTFSIKIAAGIENMVYNLTDFLVVLCPSLFSQYLIVRAVQKNEKNSKD